MKVHTKGMRTGLLTTVWLITVLACTSAHAVDELAVVAVEDKTFPHYEVFDAVVEAVHQSTVSSRIAGEVIELNFDVGDVVPKDAIILKFRDEEFQARVAQIEANLVADNASNREAIARYKEASAESERVSNLFKRKLVSQAALDKAEADLSAARARMQALTAQIKSRQAQLDEAKVNLSYTQIKAPYSGVVTERLIELGEMASPGQHLMTGISLDDTRAVVYVPQYLLNQVLQAKNPVLQLVDGRQIQGQDITLVPHADQTNHSFKIRVALPVLQQPIYPGLFGKLRFETGDERIRVVPKTAIVQRGEVSAVYVVTGDQIRLRQIRLGRVVSSTQQQVLAGLAVGEAVAIEPDNAMQKLGSNGVGAMQ
ncbi:MAG: efflux RND transporter periplasmic adaptor subunit [Gammaproteobacteria bacterium]|nr:efflux RND transporter periplasmic adaptor subunit [Gammaproteobacteria bacterium]